MTATDNQNQGHLILQAMSKLNVDLKIGDVLKIGDAEVRLEKKSGQLARLIVTANKSIEIKHVRMSASNNTEQSTHG